MINEPLLRKIADAIEEHPDAYSQKWYLYTGTPAGSAARALLRRG